MFEKNSAWSHMSSLPHFVRLIKSHDWKCARFFPHQRVSCFFTCWRCEVYACRRQTDIDSLFLWQISLSINTLLHTPTFSLIFHRLSSKSPGAAALLRQQQHKLIKLWNMSSDSRDGHSMSSKLSDLSLKFAHVTLCSAQAPAASSDTAKKMLKRAEEKSNLIFFICSHTRYTAASILCREKNISLLLLIAQLASECWAAEPFLRAAYTHTYLFSSSGGAQREEWEWKLKTIRMWFKRFHYTRWRKKSRVKKFRSLIWKICRLFFHMTTMKMKWWKKYTCKIKN